jgi:hypothetical protein
MTRMMLEDSTLKILTSSVNRNKEKIVNYKSVICHKLVSHGGALIVMCGRDEKCFSSVVVC